MNDSIPIKQIQNKLEHLQLKIDSLDNSTSLNQIRYELNDRLDIISQVNEFYDSAWLKLIIIISILGILVPIVAQYFQRKNLKDLSEFIRNQMNDSFDLKIDELKSFNELEMTRITSEFTNNISKLEEKNKNLLNELDASTFYLQGRSSVISKHYDLAINSFLKAAYLWVQSERPQRTQVVFINLRIILPRLTEHEYYVKVSQDLKKQQVISPVSLDEYFQFFYKNKHLSLYKDELDKVHAEFNRLKSIPPSVKK